VAFSTSPGATPLSQASHVMQYANQWRLVGDLWDNNWSQFTNALQVAESWRNTLVGGQIIAGSGHWPDVDMLPFGHLSLDGPVPPARYSLSTRTKGEHKVLYFLFCISNNPLQWGGNLPDNSNDRFYDSLMMCRDAIFINQHGIRGRVLRSYTTNTPVWVSTHPTDTTTKFLYLANISGASSAISVTLSTIGITGTVPVRNAWTGASLGNFTTTFSQTIPSHDAGLYILGNGTTATNPVPRTEKPVQAAGEKVFLATGNRCVIPASFAGKTVRVATYGLGGKLLNSVITRDCSVPLYKGEACGEKVGIVKITVIR
jgi:alpha-galactosidase